METVAVVDAELEKVLAAGLFELRHEERYAVVHEFGSGRECLDVVSSWAGTRVPDEIAARLRVGAALVTVEQDTRLRIFDRR